jgi:hypothetical protein
MRPGVDMLLELDDPFAYRAMIVLTDGEPASFSGVGRRRPTTYVDPEVREREQSVVQQHPAGFARTVGPG